MKAKAQKESPSGGPNGSRRSDGAILACGGQHPEISTGLGPSTAGRPDPKAGMAASSTRSLQPLRPPEGQLNVLLGNASRSGTLLPQERLIAKQMARWAAFDCRKSAAFRRNTVLIL